MDDDSDMLLSWMVLLDFYAWQPHLLVEYQRLRSDPAAVLQVVAAYAHPNPTIAQWAAAEAWIHRG